VGEDQVGIEMRTNYVLIDFESVQPERLQLLDKEHFKIKIFIGANQSKLSTSTVRAVQPMGDRAEYVQITGVGPNALDFHIAFYLGRIAATEPDAFFHIISKDKGFDPLVQHLKDRKLFVARIEDVSAIPLVKSECAKTPAERGEVVLVKLRQLKASRPRTRATLNSTIAALFQKQLSDAEIQQIVQALVSARHLSVEGTKVAYALQADA
jgi:hypothetical protein